MTTQLRLPKKITFGVEHGMQSSQQVACSYHDRNHLFGLNRMQRKIMYPCVVTNLSCALCKSLQEASVRLPAYGDKTLAGNFSDYTRIANLYIKARSAHERRKKDGLPMDTKQRYKNMILQQQHEASLMIYLLSR
jgi:hypothetical protein